MTTTMFITKKQKKMKNALCHIVTEEWHNGQNRSTIIHKTICYIYICNQWKQPAADLDVEAEASVLVGLDLDEHQVVMGNHSVQLGEEMHSVIT